MSFVELGLVEPILRALVSEGYTTPTPIQSQTIPHVLAGSDVLGCAQTGTGKTAAFALPILQRIDQTRRPAVSRAPRAVVIAPTRELASQIGQSFATYGRNLHFRHAVIFGGVGQGHQVRALSHGVHILVATPGRLLDLMSQNYVRLDQLEIFVLDEADRMLDMGFLPDLKKIISRLPRQRQSLFFSATMPENIAGLAHSLLHNPVQVSVTPPATTVQLIEQHVHFVERSNKRALLHQVVGATDCSRALVFTRTKHGADKVARQLGVEGIRADAIHGNKSQSARERALSQFRAGKLHVLVATDVAARGIDVDGISHVINYDVPTDPESYVHRIGRTGRAGATGIALTFCESSERGAFRDIEKLVRQRIQIASGSPGTAHSHEATGQRHRSANGDNSHSRAASGQPSQGRSKSFSAAGKKRHNHRHFGKKRLASSWR
ncbi:MAG TPA: DEAD/DEAH box helicase [Pirellulales bacterium]|jgi:ATP-dependent RNA helicase RhlE